MNPHIEARVLALQRSLMAAYSAGGEIMRNFLSPPSPVKRAVLMLQKEVADRMQAVPRTKSYGRLSLLTQAYWRISHLRDIPPEAFWPRRPTLRPLHSA